MLQTDIQTDPPTKRVLEEHSLLITDQICLYDKCITGTRSLFITMYICTEEFEQKLKKLLSFAFADRKEKLRF